MLRLKYIIIAPLHLWPCRHLVSNYSLFRVLFFSRQIRVQKASGKNVLGRTQYKTLSWKKSFFFISTYREATRLGGVSFLRASMNPLLLTLMTLLLAHPPWVVVVVVGGGVVVVVVSLQQLIGFPDTILISFKFWSIFVKKHRRHFSALS